VAFDAPGRAGAYWGTGGLLGCWAGIAAARDGDPPGRAAVEKTLSLRAGPRTVSVTLPSPTA